MTGKERPIARRSKRGILRAWERQRGKKMLRRKVKLRDKPLNKTNSISRRIEMNYFPFSTT